MSKDLMKLDLYQILCVKSDATDKEILKAYRKKALKVHPDKNPDNPKAGEEFHLLSRVLEILTDPAAKEAYDKIVKARAASEFRRQQLDSKRKKFKQELEEREFAAFRERDLEAQAARNLASEIERLRKEGSKLLEEEQERMREELKRVMVISDTDSKESDEDREPPRLKLKWKVKKGDEKNGGYTEAILRDFLHQYGEISALIVSRKKRGSAIVEYDSPFCALKAAENLRGLEDNPICVTWISGKPSQSALQQKESKFPDLSEASMFSTLPTPAFHNISSDGQFNQEMPSFSFDSSKFPAPASDSDLDYENLVLMRMRQAQERKKLIEAMQKEDAEET